VGRGHAPVLDARARPLEAMTDAPHLRRRILLEPCGWRRNMRSMGYVSRVDVRPEFSGADRPPGKSSGKQTRYSWSPIGGTFMLDETPISTDSHVRLTADWVKDILPDGLHAA
jgi:hypothetical protein